jgi:flagellar motor protein MotB
MKRILFAILVCALFVVINNNTFAQLGKLKNVANKAADAKKVVNSVSSKKENNDKSSEQPVNESNSTVKVQLPDQSNEEQVEENQAEETKEKGGIMSVLQTSNEPTDMWDRIDAGLPIEDFGMTDQIHAKHLKQIVFSKTFIEFGKGSEDQLQKTFNLGDEIFYMAYFERSMYNQTIADKLTDFKKDPYDSNNYDSWIVFKFTVNGVDNILGNPIMFQQKMNREEYLQWTGRSEFKAFNGFDELKYNNSLGVAYNLYVVPNLKKGENTVKMSVDYILYRNGDNLGRKEVKFEPAAPMAVGEFKVVVTDDNQVKNYLAKWNELQINAGMADAARETEILNLEKTKRGETPVKIIIESNDWYVNSDGFVIKDRTLTYSAIYKTTNPLFYKVIHNVVSQNYQGGANYGKSVLLMAEREQITPTVVVK